MQINSPETASLIGLIASADGTSIASGPGDARPARMPASSQPEAGPGLASYRAFRRLVDRCIGQLDALIGEQVNAILHHPDFQRLEASWRGLAFLVTRDRANSSAEAKVKVMHVTWAELVRDFDRAIDFDQSHLFRLIYENEFGSPGGEPFGALIGDYEVRLPSAQGGARDLDTLECIAGVAAAAFCPFLANASPSMLDLLHDFSGLERSMDSVSPLKQEARWQWLRGREDARFVGLVLPRILMRLPYAQCIDRMDGFCFDEDVGGATSSKYLWGGAAYALGAVILRSFEATAWPADIRGVQRGIDSGGLVTGLLVHEHRTDRRPGIAGKCTTDVVITERLDKELSDIGLIPLCQCHGTPFSAFYSVPSLQNPRLFDQPAAQANAKLSSMMQYVLCASRFAHYIKVIARDYLGSNESPEDLEHTLQQWLMGYVVLDDKADPETKARYPLRQASVQVLPKLGASGTYECIVHLVPHYQLDDMLVGLRLRTTLGKSARSVH